jgi:hypothetical protein
VFFSYCCQIQKVEMRMPTREILGDKWAEFFQTFTSHHDGWPVTLGKQEHGHGDGGCGRE